MFMNLNFYLYIIVEVPGSRENTPSGRPQPIHSLTYGATSAKATSMHQETPLRRA